MHSWIQITSGQGPVECCWVVYQVVQRILKECAKEELRVDILEVIPAEADHTYKSALLAVDGDGVVALQDRWKGTIRWIGASPYRPHHKRKNWYVGVSCLAPPDPLALSDKDIRIETMRASGPGGQHVNKTATAVRATHLPTKLSTVAREERSQHQNRKLALARLAQVLEEEKQKRGQETQEKLWDLHQSLERGNPVRVFEGVAFIER